MAEYDPPLNNNALFNVSDFDYQNQNVQYSDVVTLANNQIISAEKTFLSNTNLNGIINEGDTYLENMTIAGNTIIGDESGDTLVINCNGTTVNGSITSTGNVTSTNITSLTSDVADLSSNVVRLAGDQTITGTKTFTDVIIGGDSTFGDARSDTLIVESNSTFLNNVVIGDDVSTDVLNANCHVYLNKK